MNGQEEAARKRANTLLLALPATAAPTRPFHASVASRMRRHLGYGNSARASAPSVRSNSTSATSGGTPAAICKKLSMWSPFPRPPVFFLTTLNSIMLNDKNFILTLACPDRRGIVHACSGFLVLHDCNINESSQFNDKERDRFFLRLSFTTPDTCLTVAGLGAAFQPIAEEFGMDWEIVDANARPATVVMVSKLGHCLHDLLLRWRTGLLPVDIKAVVSNHRDFYQLAASYGIPFHHVPVQAENKIDAEAELMRIVEKEQVELVVLARYMQVLSDETSRRLHGRAINIHHSFLPGFKGAKPYHQAHNRGVKLIGATAHYVTADLDEGPIIEQDVARADHAMSPAALTALGRDVESVVLARAVKWHAERRVLLNGNRTVVFR